MADLTFADSHNMVAYLEKSEANADFTEIVDFLNASPISYALTTILITESSVRRDLHFDDEDGITCLTNTEIFENLQLMGYEKLSDKLTFLKPFFSPQWKYLIHTILQCLSSKSTAWNEFGTNIASAVICLAKNQKFNFSKLIFDAVFNDEYDTPSHTKKERGDSVEKAVTTASSLDVEHDSGGSPMCQEAMGDTIAQTSSERVSTPSYDSPLLGVNTPGSDEEIIKLKELMDMCTKLSNRVLDLENLKDAQALKIKKLKKRVKKLEKKNKSRTLQPKRRVYKPRVESSEESLGEKDASKHGRNSDNIEELNVAEDEHMFDLSDLAGTEVVLEEEPIELVEDKGSAEKGVSATKDKDSTADPVTIACETVTTASIPAKDKGKGIMQEPEKPVKVKGKDQIEYDADVAQRLQAELDEEARLEREREEEASNAALIKEWDSIEARIDADA
ncbi:hypothetical protein Tco_0821976 [Tanacetum coccineum]|uniref:Synaptobrevin, longin-like domain protein n=1 Tax=Tanacetum coccineum TaxID=301880 RepID=A0ABQ5AGW3_9ASTR